MILGRNLLWGKCGWYLAKIVSIAEKVEAGLKYRRGSLDEDVVLDDIDWVLVKGNGEWFLLPTETPPPPHGLCVYHWTECSQFQISENPCTKTSLVPFH